MSRPVIRGGSIFLDFGNDYGTNPAGEIPMD